MPLGLLGLRGLATGKTFDLPEKMMIIGRGPENDIPLYEMHLSRRHFRIFPHRASLVIEDLGSANGTALNGQLIRREVVPIQPGDVIDAGQTRFVVIVMD